jgi:hypothetical protein
MFVLTFLQSTGPSITNSTELELELALLNSTDLALLDSTDLTLLDPTDLAFLDSTDLALPLDSTDLALLNPATHGQLPGIGFDLTQAVVPQHAFPLIKDQEIAALQNEVAELKKDREIYIARHHSLL